MLLISSLIIGICALAPALFVIIVLNKYLASGITATLISLSIGAVLAIAFEFTFRQNRGSMMSAFKFVARRAWRNVLLLLQLLSH